MINIATDRRINNGDLFSLHDVTVQQQQNKIVTPWEQNSDLSPWKQIFNFKNDTQSEMRYTGMTRMCVYVHSAGVSAHTSVPVSKKQGRAALDLENKNTGSDSARKIKSSRHFLGQARRAVFPPTPRQTEKQEKITRIWKVTSTVCDRHNTKATRSGTDVPKWEIFISSWGVEYCSDRYRVTVSGWELQPTVLQWQIQGNSEWVWFTSYSAAVTDTR